MSDTLAVEAYVTRDPACLAPAIGRDVTPQVLSGKEAAEHLFAQSRFPEATKDLDTFKAWLEDQAPRWMRDKAYRQKLKVWNIEHAHSQKLSDLQTAKESAKLLYESCQRCIEIKGLQDHLESERKKLEGLKDFISRQKQDMTEADQQVSKRDRAISQVDALEMSIPKLEVQISNLSAAAPAYLSYNRAIEELEEFKRSIGLISEQDALANMNQHDGERRTRVGASFEKSVREVVQERIIPQLGPVVVEGQEILVLQGLTLGYCRGEIDYLIVRRDKPVALDAAPAAHHCTAAPHALPCPNDNPSGVSSAAAAAAAPPLSATGKSGMAGTCGAGRRVGGHMQPLGARHAAELGTAVTVLAAVEVKHNPNDVGPVLDKYIERYAEGVKCQGCEVLTRDAATSWIT